MDVIPEGRGIGPITTDGFHWLLGFQGVLSAYQHIILAGLALRAVAFETTLRVHLFSCWHSSTPRRKFFAIRPDGNVPGFDLFSRGLATDSISRRLSETGLGNP